jgi:hypothetical protein
MKLLTIEAFTYDELSPEAQEKARNWWREVSGDDEMDTGEEDKKEIASRMGITIRECDRIYHVEGRDGKPGRDGVEHKTAIYWSGFSSQGDGACFEGTWKASDVKPGAVKEWAPLDTELHRIAAEFERIALSYPDASFSVKHIGNYYHRFCTDFDCDPGSYEDHCKRMWPVAVGLCEKWEAVFPEAELIRAARDFMLWIYDQLEAHYEYEQSDVAVAENIEANEYLFTGEGARTFALQLL